MGASKREFNLKRAWEQEREGYESYRELIKKLLYFRNFKQNKNELQQSKTRKSSK